MDVQLERTRQVITLEERPFARGGEAGVFAVAGVLGLAAKVYYEPTPERAAKLAAMLSRPPACSTSENPAFVFAWPTDRLLAGADRQCVGYVMPRVVDARPLFMVCQPKSRLRHFPTFHHGTLLQTAANISAALAALHEQNFVVGDVNESNILVGPSAEVALVDTDSFQVRTADTVYRCLVARPEYTPPELQGIPPANMDRRPEHDVFALAVLVFQLLLQGVHPFAGCLDVPGEPSTLAERIAAGHWPHALGRRVPYRPVPLAPRLDALPPRIQGLLRRCFEDGHAQPDQRPATAEWRDALREAEQNLRSCAAQARHHYDRNLTACPWCELARQLGHDLI
jgi:DNA-binding helix-hairpin-helix protein with protein kinase domain